MTILVLGGNGFIGSAVLTRLLAAGHNVAALGRNIAHARARYPSVRWIAADLGGLASPDHWAPLLAGIDVVVNCAGALQDGPRDDVAATQQASMLALYVAAEKAGIRLIVQISANTENLADLPFFATKAAADEALAKSSVPHIILRPALVIGRNAHGGSALLRALAALPFALPLVYADRPVATVALDDVAEAVAQAVAGELSSNTDVALAGDQLTLADLVLLHRAWLGLGPARVIPVPEALAIPISWLADLAGRLGWRSPLRTTAMRVMQAGLDKGSAATGPTNMDTLATLNAHPAGVQDLWFARLYLLKPLLISSLAFFWLASGLIPFLDIGRSAIHFLPYLPETPALMLTILTSLLDIALGLAVVWRPFAARALQGQVLLSIAYLAGGTLLEPALWLDPLGPYVKVLPAILLSLVTLAILDER